MDRGPSGYYLPGQSTGEKWRAFVPHSLPPEPPIEWSSSLHLLHEKATLALGRMDGFGMILPDPQLFLYTYIRKEAVLSSQIEGTQSSLSDLLLFEIDAAPGSPLDDAREVSRYVEAMDHGLKKLREGYPISLRLLKEMHGLLLKGGRGSEKEPGEFRRSQNWIGGTRPGNAAFVPPPADYVIECMGGLENYLNRPEKTPLPDLLRAALAHVQFETIHPFLDGNGRVGRLLITLFLCHSRLLNQPLLYLSLYFKENREDYYRLLQSVRLRGNWEEWLEFFLKGVHFTATRAAETAQKLLTLASGDHQKIEEVGGAISSCLRIHNQLQKRPVTTIAAMASQTGLSVPTVTKGFDRLQKLQVLEEVSGMRRNRTFSYREYLKILND